MKGILSGDLRNNSAPNPIPCRSHMTSQKCIPPGGDSHTYSESQQFEGAIKRYPIIAICQAIPSATDSKRPVYKRTRWRRAAPPGMKKMIDRKPHWDGSWLGELFQQHHLLRLLEAAGFEAIEVDTAGHRLAGFISAIISEAMARCFHEAINDGRHPLP